MSQSFLLYAPKIVFDFIFEILYFLPWWYSRGLLYFTKKMWTFVLRKQDEMALWVWIKNIGKPLLDDYGFASRLKSVIIRLGQIAARGIILFFWVAMAALGTLLYVLTPLIIIWEIIFQYI